MNSSFADLQGKRATRRCLRCGTNSPAGIVTVAARAYGTDSAQRLKGGRTIASMSRSLCEPCIVEMYEAIERVVNSAA